MKYQRIKDPNELILRKALFLAFGTDEVDNQKTPHQLLSWKMVSKFLKQPYAKVIKLKREFFNPKKQQPKKPPGKVPTLQVFEASPLKASQVTCANITEEEVAFITDRQTLREWAPLSLFVRCSMFHRRFPNRRISSQVLTKVMK